MKINEKLLVVRKKLGLSKAQMADGVIVHHITLELKEVNLTSQLLI